MSGAFNLQNGLIGWWCPSLDATGSILVDRSGRNIHGTLVNMDPATDWVVSGGKYALDFDNTNDRVDTGVITAINSGEVSFSFWYYPNSVSGLNTIFSNWSVSVVNVGFFCYRTSAGILFQQATGANGLVTGSILTANTWHHIVCRRADGTGGMRVFCNGVMNAASGTPGGTQASTAVFNFCGNYGGAGAGNCQIDDFRIYNRALTNGEVAQLWQLGRGNMPLRRRRRCVEQAAGGFKAYWARRQSQLIGGGV
jgi:hypothetical protein